MNRIIHVFVGYDWGLVFTAPFLLLGIAGLGLLDIRIKKRFIWACLPLLVNFYTIIFFGSQGGYYGYRYLIASAFPLFVIPLAFLLRWLNHRIGYYWKWGAVLLALLPVMSMWCYESNKLVATNIIPVSFGKTDWSNAVYQIAVWQTVFNLKAFWETIYLGGIQYCHYLFYAARTLFAFRSNQPFEMKTLIQVFIIYSLPFVMVWIFRDKFQTVEVSPKKSFRVKGIFFVALVALIGCLFISMKVSMSSALPNDVRAIQLAEDYNRGLFYIKQGNFPLAIVDFSQAIELNPKFIPAYGNLGVIYANQGKLVQAIAVFTKAIEIDPNYAPLYYNRYRLYYQLREYDKSWADVHKAEALGVNVEPGFIRMLKRDSGRDN